MHGCTFALLHWTRRYGTALGVVRSLHACGKLKQVYACETRPYNQGSRLTAFEIVADQLPGTLICDSMASAAMRHFKVRWINICL